MPSPPCCAGEMASDETSRREEEGFLAADAAAVPPRPRAGQKPGRAGAAVACGVLAACTVALHWQITRPPAKVSTSSLAVVGLAEKLSSASDMGRCGWSEEHMDFQGTDIAHLSNISDAGTCCAQCQENPRCRVWMYGEKEGNSDFTDGGDRVCTLRFVDPSSKFVDKKPRWGVVSGLPFDWVRHNSLFCFALMQPRGYERELIALQHRKRWSLFDCDEYQVVSNESMQLAPGLRTVAITSDLKCEKGGEFGTALNNDIFALVWKQVIDGGRYKYNDWTVKVDPDCAFFPQRLRVAVAFHPDTYHGIYLNNCKFGLHGPLEILSGAAMDIWSAGYERCRLHFNEVCSGPCLWGEDMFFDQCMLKVLQVHRSDDWNLLSEPHCDNPGWEKCSDHKVAFHPFKTTSKYEECVAAADYGSLPLVA